MSVSDLWTYERYARLPDDGKRHQIIAGEHFVTPAPALRHQELLGRLHLALSAALPDGAKVYLAPCDVVISEHDVVQPDLLFLAATSLERAGSAFVDGAPDLAIEILSPSTRALDLRHKLALYERSGVTEYWVVDGADQSVTVFRRKAGGSRFEPSQLFEVGRSLGSDLLPDLHLDLAELFAD